ncbi:MAG: hypothetical protein IPJ65_28755 [Archangiaceae bacterium]|nr:hypothetical protein [Archangiaceae bacterium]
MKHLALAAAVLCAALAGEARAQEYVRTTVKNKPDLPLYWNSRCMVYRMGAQGSSSTPGRDEVPAIDASLASWQKAAESCGNGWQYVRGEPVPVKDYHLGPVDGQATQTQILFRDLACEDVVPIDDECATDPGGAHVTCGNKFQCMWGDPFVIGLTTVIYRTRTGEIVDTDVEMNGAPFHEYNLPGKVFTAVDGPPCSDMMVVTEETGDGGEGIPGQCVAFDIQNTLTHEFGHAMGFDHVEEPGSTMYASAEIGETTKRVIDPGTLAGFCAVYGAPEKTSACVDTSIGALSPPTPVTGGCSATGFAPLLLALTTLLLRRRR